MIRGVPSRSLLINRDKSTVIVMPYLTKGDVNLFIIFDKFIGLCLLSEILKCNYVVLLSILIHIKHEFSITKWDMRDKGSDGTIIFFCMLTQHVSDEIWRTKFRRNLFTFQSVNSLVQVCLLWNFCGSSYEQEVGKGDGDLRLRVTEPHLSWLYRVHIFPNTEKYWFTLKDLESRCDRPKICVDSVPFLVKILIL